MGMLLCVHGPDAAQNGKEDAAPSSCSVEGRQAPYENTRQGAAPIAGRISQVSFSYKKSAGFLQNDSPLARGRLQNAKMKEQRTSSNTYSKLLDLSQKPGRLTRGKTERADSVFTKTFGGYPSEGLFVASIQSDECG